MTIPPFDELDQNTGGEDGTKINLVGVLLHLRPGNDSVTYEHQLARAKDSSSSPGAPLSSTWQNVGRLPRGQRNFFDQLPFDRVKRWYRARAVRPGETEGVWTQEVCAVPKIITNEVLDAWRQYRDEGRDRTDSLWDGDGRLNEDVGVNDQSGLHGLNRHNESGLAQDGDTINFSRAYKSNPELTFTLECGRTFLSTGSTDDQFIDMRGIDVTTTGFSLSAKIITGPGTSANIDGFSTAQSTTTAPENGDEQLTVEGDEVWSTLEGATSGSASTYQVLFDVNTALMSSTETATVNIYTSTGGGSTDYTFRTSRQYGSGATLNDEILQFSATLGENQAVRSVLNYAGSPGEGFAAVITMHGEDNSEPGMQWLKPTGGTEETMTPNTGDRVRWHAVEAP